MDDVGLGTTGFVHTAVVVFEVSLNTASGFTLWARWTSE